MNKIVSFGVNVLMDLVLVMDSGLLALIDIKTKKEYKSRRATKEKFATSCFTSDNKGVILINQSMKVYVLNISDLKERWTINLPITFTEPKI
jgi:hypothetical protein